MAIDGPTVIVVGAGTNAVADYANPDPMDQFMWYQTHGCGPAGGAELPRGQRSGDQGADRLPVPVDCGSSASRM
jgi:hypothetical protein